MHGGTTDVTLRQARDAVTREAWADAYGLLRGLDAARLTPDDCAGFADAARWTSRIEESIVQRTRAYSGYAAAGAARRAAYCAWMLFYEHQLAGRDAVASGWLRRARNHLNGEPECVEQCYLAWVDAERAQERGAFDEAMAAARRMTAVARRCGSPDLHAMGVQAARRKGWVRAFHRGLEPHALEGGYVNFMDADDQHRVRADYRGSHARLTELKRRHDPESLFRLNHNIVS
ncbi:BBE domain-containing protein [Streptomyces sp. HUCO-GS316]|uniref:BBE domain-containing protein n=1 Tax=Streptomyces sp. HUCO-GS316 TaxID=2692198 RepID=UPI00301DAEC4